jgi:hypothetical protein
MKLCLLLRARYGTEAIQRFWKGARQVAHFRRRIAPAKLTRE